jgi:hypothetical protein
LQERLIRACARKRARKKQRKAEEESMDWNDEPAVVVRDREIGSVEAKKLANERGREVVYWRGEQMKRIRPDQTRLEENQPKPTHEDRV